MLRFVAETNYGHENEENVTFQAVDVQAPVRVLQVIQVEDVDG